MGTPIQGPNVYPVVADTPRSGDFGYSDANDGTSFRDNVSFPCDKCNRETTWIFKPGTGGGGGSTGEDVTVKMGSHGSESDQTALIAFGAIPYSGGGGTWKSEGPHGNDGSVSGDVNEGSVDLTGDQPMGIKGISWNIDPAGTQHHEIWINPAGTLEGTWTLAAQFTGTSDTNPLTCPIPPDGGGNCQDTLRLDGATPTGYEFIERYQVEINQGDGTPVGGGTPPTLIPTKPREGGDSEGGGGGGDDTGGGDTGDGDGGDGDGGDTGVASCDDDTGVCTCNSGKVSTIPSANPCATECPKSCGGYSSVVRDRLRNRRRTGNQAKRVFYSKMRIKYRTIL